MYFSLARTELIPLIYFTVFPLIYRTSPNHRNAYTTPDFARTNNAFYLCLALAGSRVSPCWIYSRSAETTAIVSNSYIDRTYAVRLVDKFFMSAGLPITNLSFWTSDSEHQMTASGRNQTLNDSLPTKNSVN